MDLENLYEEKNIDEKSKKNVLKTISSLQLFANILDLYAIKSLETSVKFIEVITNKSEDKKPLKSK